MNEAVATIVVAGTIQVVGMVVGFLTLWVKLRYAGMKAEEAADKAEVVERKLDDNTATTKAVDAKATSIVEQTDGETKQMRILIETISERVSKLEDQNRERGHRLLDAINALHLKVATLGCLLPVQSRPSEDRAK